MNFDIKAQDSQDENQPKFKFCADESTDSCSVDLSIPAKNIITIQAYLQSYLTFKSHMDQDDKIFYYTKTENRIPGDKRIINRCPHLERKYYAKGMCNLCYLSFGRNSLATKCPHSNRMYYALQMCLQCYHKNKHFLKRNRKVQR